MYNTPTSSKYATHNAWLVAFKDYLSGWAAHKQSTPITMSVSLEWSNGWSDRANFRRNITKEQV